MSYLPAAPTAAPTAGPSAAPERGDALWRSPLPPFVRGHRFIERVAQLSPAEWREVLRRAHAVAPVRRAAGLRALTERLVGHPQSRAFGALTRAAHDAAEIAGRRRVVPDDAVGRVAGLASQAATALALRDELPAAHALVHYAPFTAAETVSDSLATALAHVVQPEREPPRARVETRP